MIDQIIALKESYNLIEDDATFDKQVEWYSFALSNNLVITVYENSKLLGFLEYVRLDRLPKSFDDLAQCSSDFVGGKILLVSNAISDCADTLWKMKKELFQRNRNMTHLVWHRKRDGVMKIFKNIRSIKNES